MRKIVLLAALALAVPSIALAAKPPAPGNSQSSHGKAPQVLYVLKGTLVAYSNPGTVTINIVSANHYRSVFKNQTLQLTVTGLTKVAADGGTVTAGHKGIVKLKAPKNLAAATLLSTLQGMAASQVIDQGPAS
jgi:ABC-type oligopeptide transport system substrate-binding subunit